MSDKGNQYEIGTVWPQQDHTLIFFHKQCKSIHDMEHLREECSAFLRSSHHDDQRLQVASKISWLLKWLGLREAPKEHQWQLVNSNIPQKNIQQKLYTFNQLLKLNSKQSSSLFSPAVQTAMIQFKLNLSVAVNLTYFQKQILHSTHVQKKISQGKLSVERALNLSRPEFREINTPSTAHTAVKFNKAT